MAQKQEPMPACKTLVLDAGPLLSLSPLRGLAERYITVPQVLLELKDKDAREHFERLGLIAGVHIEVQEPDPASLLEVSQTARKTGDYGVLSNADLRVLALTLSLDKREKERKEKEKASQHTQVASEPSTAEVDAVSEDLRNLTVEAGGGVAEDVASNEVDESPEDEITERQPLETEYAEAPAEQASSLASSSSPSAQKNDTPRATVVFEDPSDSDDGEGEWITPSNVALHKSRALDLLPSTSTSDSFTTVTKKSRRSRKSQNAVPDDAPAEQMDVGCMTADFAMQNVLLQMGLNLVSVEGKRIQRVKTWVLRCHACFKICKDNSKKFCPSCGNPTLLRTSVTVSAPGASGSEPAMQVHLKKNFVYRNRGTKYSIPAPHPGSSKTGSGEGLILREDQQEYVRAKKRVDGQREKQEKKMLRDALNGTSADGTGVKLGNWSDPDWMPELMSIGTGGKGRKMADSRIGPDGMPVVGYGKKNPNERRRKA